MTTPTLAEQWAADTAAARIPPDPSHFATYLRGIRVTLDSLQRGTSRAVLAAECAELEHNLSAAQGSNGNGRRFESFWRAPA